MKYFKDANNQVYAYEADGSQDGFIKDGFLAIPESEANELRKPKPPTSKEEINAPIVSKLSEIDIKSIRAIREYIASKTDAPQFTKDLDAQAQAERAKLVK